MSKGCIEIILKEECGIRYSEHDLVGESLIILQNLSSLTNSKALKAGVGTWYMSRSTVYISNFAYFLVGK